MNPTLLQTENEVLRQKNASLEQALEQTRREVTLLRQKLDALARRFFGKKSEQLDAAQLQLLLSGLAQLETQPAPENQCCPQ
jgi:predicted RNase H-like nuclease (RuvC/YqgF family)